MASQENEHALLSKEVHWFVETLRDQFQVSVTTEEIAVEATELGMEEVADFYVPSELFEVAPETLLYEIMVMDDERQNEWIGAVAYYPNLPDWCLQVLTKNGELVLRKVLSVIE